MKQRTIKLFGLLAGLTVVMGNIEEVRAIPVVDDFQVELENSNNTDASSGFGGPSRSTSKVNQGTDGLSDSIFDGGTSSEGERDVEVFTVRTVGSSGFIFASLTAGDNSSPPAANEDFLVLESFTGSGATSESTFTLQYDGEDNTFNPTSPDTTNITGFDVRDGAGSVTNNVFAIRDFGLDPSTDTPDKVELKIELFDDGGDSVTVVDAEDGTTADGFFELTLSSDPEDGDFGDIFIALQESDISAAGIDTDGRFFEDAGSKSFDFTQVAAVEFSARMTVSDGDNSKVRMDKIGFEQIPFEAESSIGISLLGAWGIWKRWKKKREQMTPESNAS